MEDLLCDEVWLSSPEIPEHFHEPGECIVDGDVGSFNVMTKEESEQALIMCLQKELSYVPKPQYVEYLHSNGLVLARFGAVVWLIKSRARLNLSVGTVFSAVNYLDRFMSMSHSHSWKCWMIELLSVACLSIASKFNETSTPPFHEIQMEGLEHSFRSNTIQWMELALMNALQWRLNCTTTYSYVELMISNSICNKSHKELTNQVTKTLLAAQLDLKLLEYPPSVIAASAVHDVISSSCGVVHLHNISNLLNQHQKDGFAECHMIMQAWLADPFFSTLINASDDDEYSCYCPSSPVTVLFKEPINVNDCQVDLSLFKMSAGSDLTDLESNGKKRKREEEEEE
ncbi:hypothetical protein SLE2022_104110 [Rubroshorea leprosula]